MEAGITSYHGDRFREFCCNPTVKDQIVCAQDGCNAKVHQFCQWAWVQKARLPCVASSPIFCPEHNIQRGDYIRWYFRSRKQPIPPSLLPRLASNPSNVATSKIEPVPLLNSGTSPALNGVAQNCDGESNQATLSSTAENTTGTSTSKERPNDEYRRVAIPPSLLLTLASNPSNVITSENGPVPLLNSGTSLISARNNYIMHFIYISYQHFRYRNFIMLFQETETARITCAWGMEKELTQHFGNPFGEFCCTPTLKGQLTCDHDGCNAKVHRDCQWMWLNRARLPVETRSPVYCPKHNGRRGDYIRSYYEYRRVAINSISSSDPSKQSFQCDYI